MKSNQIGPGQMTAVDLQGTRVAIANVDGAFYAFSDACPHDAASLSQGKLSGLIVACREDGSQFDLPSGRVLAGPSLKRVRTYRIQIAGDELLI
jgi:3-phenylpropionate/trans-cinnamate dioxygenase ferredoxin subunit